MIEATATRWSWHRDRLIYSAVADEHWRTTSAGANVLLRAGRARLAGSFGMGAALAATGGVRVALRTPPFDAEPVRKADPVRDGILRGTIAGAAGGAFFGYGAGEPDSSGGEMGQAVMFSAVGAGIGAGIGFVIDAVRFPRKRASP